MSRDNDIFQKSFDKIDHSILIAKLSNLGIDNNIVSLVKDFQNNKQQFVV